jgi:putative tryptophan/tyrosine transport system substrate-binding protein
MKRREFIGIVSGVAAWPFAAQAQQPAMPAIGYLTLRAAGDSRANVAALRQGLGEAGFFVGQNVTIEIRYAEGQYDRLPALITELIQRPVSVLFTSSQDIARVAKAATTTTPVVFISGGDPAKLGLVDSLARPGGNLTGVNFVASELWAKQLGLLTVGLLTNPKNVFTESGIRDAQSAAAVLGLKLIVSDASIEADFEPAIASLVRQGTEALFVPTDPFFNGRAGQLVSIAARRSLPAAYALREYAAAGGMMSYGASLLDAHRQVGTYIGRILKGTRPTDLPVLQPTKFELVINLRTVKALGLTVPPTLLAQADEVIE